MWGARACAAVVPRRAATGVRWQSGRRARQGDILRRELVEALRREYREETGGGAVATDAGAAHGGKEASELAEVDSIKGWDMDVTPGGGTVVFSKQQPSGWKVAARFDVSPPAAMPRGLVEERDAVPRVLCLLTLTPPAPAHAHEHPRSDGHAVVPAEAAVEAADALTISLWVYPARYQYVLQDYTLHPPTATDADRHLYFTTAAVDSPRDAVPFAGLASTAAKNDQRAGGFRFLEEQLAERGVTTGFLLRAAEIVERLEHTHYTRFLREAAEILSV